MKIIEIKTRRYIDLSQDKSQKRGGNYHTCSKGKECTLYVIECYDKMEKFIKIGVTSNSIKKRFSGNKSMPYSYKVIKEVKSYDNETLLYLESMCLDITDSCFYIPMKPFNGSTECRSVSSKKPLLSYLDSMGSLEDNKEFLKQMAGKDEEFNKRYEDFMGIPLKYASKMFNKKAERYFSNKGVEPEDDFDLPFDLSSGSNTPNTSDSDDGPF